MRIDKAIDKMKHLKYKVLQGAIIVHDTYSDDYELLDESALTALDMSIASLKAWQEVRQKIGKLSLSWEYGQGVEDCLAIIDHYMQEVDDGK